VGRPAGRRGTLGAWPPSCSCSSAGFAYPWWLSSSEFGNGRLRSGAKVALAARLILALAVLLLVALIVTGAIAFNL
jgi:hypothetical protein